MFYCRADFFGSISDCCELHQEYQHVCLPLTNPQTAGVRLLYWPVTRVGNVCDGESATAEGPVISGTATGDGPNTYADPDVIGTLTITSPTVAISFGRLASLVLVEQYTSRKH